MAEQAASTNIKQLEENKSGFALSEAVNANKSKDEIGKVEGRYFAELDKAIVNEERQKADEEFEPMPSFLLGEEEKTAVTSRPVSILFINNLPATITEAGVKNIFRDFGEILNVEIKGSTFRKPTNFAKVSFATRQEAASAIHNVNKKPPLYLNVAFERAQEARDFKNKQYQEREKFGNEWAEKWKHVEKVKEKIVKDIFGQETVEPNNEIESGNKSIQMDQDNGIAPKSGVEEENEQSCKSKQDSKMNRKDTVVVETSNNFKGKKKSVPSVDSVTERVDVTDGQSSGTNSSADSPAIFGYELFVPYLAPGPCLECRHPGRMLCSRCRAWYCSLNCQVNNWPKHKDLCHPVHAQGGITLLGEGSKFNKRNPAKREKSSGRAKSDVSFDSQLNQVRSNQDNDKPSNKVAIESMQSSSTDGIEKVETVRRTNIPEVEINGIIEPVKAAEPEMLVQATIVPDNQWNEILQPISAIESPHRFWVQPKFNQELLKKLGKSLDEHIATAADIVDANEGAFRLVEVGGCWHRALVLRVDHNSGEALARLIDLGGDIHVKCNSLLRLPPHLASTPALAVQVGMAGLKPPSGEHWTNENQETFKFFLCADINETKMWIKPRGFSDGTWLVSMKNQEGNDLAELYIELGLARKIHQVANFVEIPAIKATYTENNSASPLGKEDEAIETIQKENNNASPSAEEDKAIGTVLKENNNASPSAEEDKAIGTVLKENNNVSPSGKEDEAIETIQTENNNVSPSAKEDEMKLFKSQYQQNRNWETTGYVVETPSVMPAVSKNISKPESGKNLEEILLPGRKEEDLFSTKSIVDQLKVGNVYEFGRAEGHPLSEFGAMCHFDSTTFDYIYTDMQREYNGSAPYFGPGNPANPGDMVVAYCADKSTFYRAVILLPTEDDAVVEVLLADVGYTELVPFQHLRVMAGRASNLDEFPFLAVRFFSLDSLSPQAEGTMTTDPSGKIRVQVEGVEEGGVVVGVLNQANTAVAKYKVDAWQYLHPRIAHLFPTEINGGFPQTVSRHQAVLVSQMKPVRIADGDTVILRTIGKFACFGMIQLTETEPTFRALKQALAICETLPRVDFPPEVGQILAVQKSAGRKMMRAEVVKIDEPGRKATVRCLDYPDILVLPWTNMTLIPDTALSISTQCRLMRLAGVPKLPRKQALPLLQPITTSLERPLRLEYHHEDQSLPSVYLYESSGARINELIISTLAQSTTEVQDSPLKISSNPPISVASSEAKSKAKISSTNLAWEYDPANFFMLPVGEDKEVFILSVKDKSHLHVCSVDVVDQLTNLQENLQKTGSLAKNSSSSVAVNNVYLAQSADGKWYRAVVLKTRHRKCVAYFPDFGFKEKIAFENIQDFHGDFYDYVKSVPFFASACVINNMTDENGNVLDEISTNSTRMIRVRRKDAQHHSIDVLNLQSALE